jgi:hypothetical protein
MTAASENESAFITACVTFVVDERHAHRGARARRFDDERETDTFDDVTKGRARGEISQRRCLDRGPGRRRNLGLVQRLLGQHLVERKLARMGR